MDISITDIKNIAQAFQGLAAGLAILIGGGWALYRFSALKEIERSRLELDKKEQELLQQPVLDLSISARSNRIKDPKNLYLEILVKAKNQGNRNARLAYEDSFPLSVYKVIEAEENQKYELVCKEKVRAAVNPNEFVKATAVRAGQTQEIPFFIPIDETGLYFVAFRTIAPSEVREHLETVGLPKHRTLSWTAKCYVIVEEKA